MVKRLAGFEDLSDRHLMSDRFSMIDNRKKPFPLPPKTGRDKRPAFGEGGWVLSDDLNFPDEKT